MKSCKIILFSGGGEIYAVGEMEKFERGFKLFYELDGDKCRAEYLDGAFTQTRRGSFNMSVRFKENEKSECVISENGLSGALEVFTEKLSVKIEDNGVTVSINYQLGGEEKTIKLTALER